MVLHARAQRERIAREAAAAATLDLADRTCHELGNVAFVVANERRNLASHIELLERFVAEDAEAHAEAARRAGLDPATAARFDHALRREYADRGIDPEFELRGQRRDRPRRLPPDRRLLRLHRPDRPRARRLPEAVDDPGRARPARARASASTTPWPCSPRGWRRPTRGSSGPRPTGPSPGVLADRRLLIHALVNLIKNAVEAAAARRDDAGRSGSRRGSRGTTAWLSVADNGPGIPPGELRRIFEAGYSTKGTGRGLGLAIVRESIAAQGGTLEVESRPGRGTEFRIGLPLADGA